MVDAPFAPARFKAQFVLFNPLPNGTELAAEGRDFLRVKKEVLTPHA